MSRLTKLSEITREECAWYMNRFTQLHSKMPDTILSTLKGMDEREISGITQLEHALQSATLAIADNASPEMVLGALVHDIGKALAQNNHGSVSAEMIRPYVSADCYHIVATHEIFQGQHYYGFVGRDPQSYKQFKNESWYEGALIFNRWDEGAFRAGMKTVSVEEMRKFLVQFFADKPWPMKMAG